MSQAENETGQPQGMFKDVKRLRSDGTASVEELRAFLGELTVSYTHLTLPTKA